MHNFGKHHPPTPTVNLTKPQLIKALKAAAQAHHDYEKKMKKKDVNWQKWYANHMFANK